MISNVPDELLGVLTIVGVKTRLFVNPLDEEIRLAVLSYLQSLNGVWWFKERWLNLLLPVLMAILGYIFGTTKPES